VLCSVCLAHVSPSLSYTTTCSLLKGCHCEHHDVMGTFLLSAHSNPRGQTIYRPKAAPATTYAIPESFHVTRTGLGAGSHSSPDLGHVPLPSVPIRIHHPLGAGPGRAGHHKRVASGDVPHSSARVLHLPGAVAAGNRAADVARLVRSTKPRS
jgi:hypothetical protein